MLSLTEFNNTINRVYALKARTKRIVEFCLSIYLEASSIFIQVPSRTCQSVRQNSSTVYLEISWSVHVLAH